MISTVLRKTIDAVIAIYQKTLSPDHSGWGRYVFPNGYCKFHPTCSVYARRVIIRDGIIFGSMKIFFRVLRCNPWSRGGMDEP